MRIVIWKQWKTSARRYWGLRKLGAPEWIARKSVAFGNHYQAFAKTTGLRYISKEILARRGLSKLFGLLFELNRRVPNGTHGGMRGATG